MEHTSLNVFCTLSLFIISMKPLGNPGQICCSCKIIITDTLLRQDCQLKRYFSSVVSKTDSPSWVSMSSAFYLAPRILVLISHRYVQLYKPSITGISLWGSQFHFRIQHLLINMTSICMHRTVYFHTVTVLAERFGSVYLFM